MIQSTILLTKKLTLVSINTTFNCKFDIINICCLQASLAVEESITINAARKSDNTISENYAFTGVHHIFDQVMAHKTPFFE